MSRESEDTLPEELEAEKVKTAKLRKIIRKLKSELAYKDGIISGLRSEIDSFDGATYNVYGNFDFDDILSLNADSLRQALIDYPFLNGFLKITKVNDDFE